MPRIGAWNSGRKGNDYRFIDRVASEWFGAGTAAYVHLYLGTHDQREPPGVGDPPLAPIAINERSIQDVLFLENRDRKYSDVVYELRTAYNIQDSDFDLKQFGLFLTGDTIFLPFHHNDMVALLGRRIMPGDVIELPHLRDERPNDPDAKAINKFYVVEDANFASDGYSATWFAHVWRARVKPMTDAQEYRDILDKQAKNPLGFDQGRLGDLMSTVGTELGINEQVVDQAKANFLRRNFETQQFWVVSGTETTGQNPWIYAGDGIPPNGAVLVGSGAMFPAQPDEGDYYLRTDYAPHALFKREGGAWRMQELAYRDEWSAAHRVLWDFLSNTENLAFEDGTILPRKGALSKAVRPRADL